MTGAGGPAWGRAAAEYRAAGTRAGRRRLGACAVEGTRLFERALRAGAALRGVMVSQGVIDAPDARAAELLGELDGLGVGVRAVPDSEFAELTGGRDLGGFAGLAGLPEPWESGRATGAPGRPGSRLLLAAAGLDDPGNVGALARTAHASGAEGLLLVGCTDAFHPRAVRTSMGSLFRLPVAERDDLQAALEELHGAGWVTYATVSSGGEALDRAQPAEGESSAVFLGSEAFGLAREGLAAFRRRITIPMPPGVDSFSVNAAAAVALYGLMH